MDSLIPVVNRLQDVFNDVGMQAKIDLPQIAVVGAQSSGKSSVLESLVGRDFLPRGAGIVTRRPLVLQLLTLSKKVDADGNPVEPWGEFLHLPGKKFSDFTKIREEIDHATDQDAGSGKAISANPIGLRIYSPDVLNLTLVDLPGITKVAVGDQPADIEQQTRTLVLQYISRPNCIILAVSAANQDIANSDALKIAKEVDPNGDRTIGVLTKLDLMDKGTDAVDVLTGKVIPLKRGFIGVVNRSQQDIVSNKDVRKALDAETKFFQTHPAYSRLAGRLGTPYLAKTLNAILLHHIRETLPDLKIRISKLIDEATSVLSRLGADTAELNSGALLLDLITKYVNGVFALIDGQITTTTTTNELAGGARINWIFHQAFAPYILSLNACEGLTDEHIRATIENAKGTRSSLFVPEQCFEMLVRQQVPRLEDPCHRCGEKVLEELLRMCKSGESQLARFPKLRDRVSEEVLKLLRSFMTALREFVHNLVEIELAYINTHHPHFFDEGNVYDKLLTVDPSHNTPRQGPSPPPQSAQTGSSGPMLFPVNAANLASMAGLASSSNQASMQSARQPQQPQGAVPANDAAAFARAFADVPDAIRPGISERTKREVEIMKELLKTYFGIVQISFADKIPKAIAHFMINRMRNTLQNELVGTFYKESLFKDLLAESPEVAAQRVAASQLLKCLNAAAETLNEVRDFRL